MHVLMEMKFSRPKIYMEIFIQRSTTIIMEASK